MRKLTKKQVKKIQDIGEESNINNLGSAIKNVTDHMATPDNELSMFDKIVLNQICPECKGHTITVSCKKLKALGKCKSKANEMSYKKEYEKAFRKNLKGERR